MKRIIPLIFFGMASAGVIGQGTAFPLQTDPDKGWEVMSTRVYNGTGLWGYIDGGADIYLEYGFDRVYVQEIRFDDHLVKMETYCMADSMAAFGIFSVNRFHCENSDTLGYLHCISPYQILAAIGRYYLILSNQEGTPDATQSGIRLLMHVSEMIRADSLIFPKPFTVSDAKGQLKCMKGPLGVMNGYPVLSDLFEPFREFTLFILPLPGKTIKPITARVDFSDISDRNQLEDRLLILQQENKGQIILHERIHASGLLFCIGNKTDLKALQSWMGLLLDE